MNWRCIVKYAAALFVAQTGIGFLEGFLFPPSVVILLSGAAASFVVCGAIFTHLGTHQSRKPYFHAWAVLLLHVAAATVFAQILARWVESSSVFLIALELFVLVFALLAGTSLGIMLRQRAGQIADAQSSVRL